MHRPTTRLMIVALTAAAAVAAGGVALGARSDDDQATPAWFQPIADYYGGNSKITPETDFAELHFGGLDAMSPKSVMPKGR